MKSTIILGLALAASAQVDNELVSGADLVRNAGWGRSNPTGTRVPIDYNTKYLNKYGLTHDDAADDEMMVYYTKDSRGVNHYQGGYTRDDAADDELVQTFYSPSGADLVKYAKQSQQTVYRPTAHVVSRDDAVDDELVGYNPSGANLVRDAAWGRSNPAGTRVPTDYNTQYLNKYGKTHDDAADDELVQTFYSPSGADLVKYAKQSQQTVYRPTAHVVSRDDATDDELVGYNPSGANLVRDAAWGRSRPTGYRVPVDYNTQYLNKYGKTHDDAIENELVQTFYSPSGADLVKYAKQSQQTVYRPTAHVISRDDTVENELATTFYSPSGADLVKYAKQSQQTVYRPTAHVVSRDDELSELATLMDLIKEAKAESKTNEIRRRFRPVEKN